MVRASWPVPSRPGRAEGHEDEAESARSLSDIARNFPPCAHRPIDDWLKASPCHSVDYACFCSDQHFIATMHSALGMACALNMQAEAIQYFRRLCAGVGIDLPVAFRLQVRETPPVSSLIGGNVESTIGVLTTTPLLGPGPQITDSTAVKTSVFSPSTSSSSTPDSAIASSPSTSRAVSPAVTLPSSTSSSNSPTTTGAADDNGGLSSSAKIGVGVGVGIGGALLVAVIAFLVYRLMKQRKDHQMQMSEQRGWEPGVSMRN